MKLLKSRNYIATFALICAVGLLTAETANMRKSDRLRQVTRLSNCPDLRNSEAVEKEEEKDDAATETNDDQNNKKEGE